MNFDLDVVFSDRAKTYKICAVVSLISLLIIIGCSYAVS
jgi:hypothetical protein